MSRIRIEGLLAAFPKLMGTGENPVVVVMVRVVSSRDRDLHLRLVRSRFSSVEQMFACVLSCMIHAWS